MYHEKIKHLEEAHRMLNAKIDKMEKTGVYDDMNIETLKKERLLLKDQITILKHKQKRQDYEND